MEFDKAPERPQPDWRPSHNAHSDLRPPHHHRKPYVHSVNSVKDFPAHDRPFVPETVHTTEEFEVERKAFKFEFCENHQGQFLRITEKGNHKFNRIIIPSSGIHNFQNAIAKVTLRIPAPAA